MEGNPEMTSVRKRKLETPSPTTSPEKRVKENETEVVSCLHSLRQSTKVPQQPIIPQDPIGTHRIRAPRDEILAKPTHGKRLPARMGPPSNGDESLQDEAEAIPLGTGRNLTDRQRLMLLLLRPKIINGKRDNRRQDAYLRATAVYNDRIELQADFLYLRAMSNAFLRNLGLTRDRIPPPIAQRPGNEEEFAEKCLRQWDERFPLGWDCEDARLEMGGELHVAGLEEQNANIHVSRFVIHSIHDEAPEEDEIWSLGHRLTWKLDVVAIPVYD